VGVRRESIRSRSDKSGSNTAKKERIEREEKKAERRVKDCVEKSGEGQEGARHSSSMLLK